MLIRQLATSKLFCMISGGETCESKAFLPYYTHETARAIDVADAEITSRRNSQGGDPKAPFPFKSARLLLDLQMEGKNRITIE